MNIKEKIQFLCRQKDISVHDFEEKSGLKIGTVGKWDVSIPSFDRIEKAANYFHVSVDFFSDAPGLTMEQQELLAKIPRMPQGEVSVLLATAKAQEAVRQDLDSSEP